ncbi:MAG: hypothetical protein AB1513_05255 [Pseudomonadota bacterium]
MAKLLEGAERSLTDPCAKKEMPRGLYLFIMALLWHLGYFEKWLG